MAQLTERLLLSSRSDLEDMDKAQVISAALALREAVRDTSAQLAVTDQKYTALQDKYKPGRLLLTDAVGPAVVFTMGELISWLLYLFGQPNAQGQQGMISAHVGRNWHWYRTVPHLVAGVLGSYFFRPTERSGVFRDATFEGAKALAQGASVRILDRALGLRQEKARETQDLQARLVQMDAAIKAAEGRAKAAEAKLQARRD